MSLVSWFKSLFKVAEAPKVAEKVEYERVRTKDCKGRFVADDPTTDKNEAWTKKELKKKVAKKKVAKKKARKK
tara:strand:+ start:132 stop:350 length:219 start_codon:yes stop_codon:yes gene_type:complete